MTQRLDPFAHLVEELPTFAPKAKAEKPVPREAIEKIAENNNFPSRQPGKSSVQPRRRPRRFRTGRDQQLGIRMTAETKERFYRAADERNVPLGELLRLALEALERAGATAEHGER